MCDYLGNPSFRTEILNLLNQGESVHSLERAIHAGGIGARRGRTSEQMAAISGALSLLANIVMAWNTQQMQALARRSPEQFPDQLLSQVAPIAHALSICAGFSRSNWDLIVKLSSDQIAPRRPGERQPDPKRRSKQNQ